MVGPSRETVAKIEEEVDSQAWALSHGQISCVNPPRLILHVPDSKVVVEEVQTAGSVFVGLYSPKR
jgi:hypothetical protein